MDEAEAAGNIGLWASFAAHASEVELRRGHTGTAEDLIDQVYRIAADGRHDAAWLSYRALVRAWVGRLEDARADATDALAMARRDRNLLYEVLAQHGLGFVELSAGRPAAAARHYAAVAAGMESMGWRHPSLVVWHANAVEAWVAADRRAEAETLTEALDAMARTHALATARAAAARCRGLVLEGAGDLDGAAAAFDEAVSRSESLDIPLELARTLLLRGVLHRRRRRKALARDDLTCARDLFRRHGAVGWTARASAELDRSVGSGSSVGPTGLTASERAVAERAASGATNREIAAALYLSEKTVEAVLTRVYRKLEVRSRAQLARHPSVVPGLDAGREGDA